MQEPEWTKENPLRFSHFPSALTRLENLSFLFQREDDSLPTDQLIWALWIFVYIMPILKRLLKNTFTILKYENSPEPLVL